MIEVVTLEDMRAHLGLTEDNGSADDALIRSKIAAATEHTARAASVDFEEIEGDVPEDLKEAIRLLAAHLYENREASIVGVTASAIPFGYDDLIRPHRQEWF